MKISYNINSEERNLFMDIAHIKKQIEECLSEKWSYDRVSKINIVNFKNLI